MYSIHKIQIGSKSLNKWKDYTTEIKPEYFNKLNEFIDEKNNGEGKKTKAFGLKKNGHNTNIFQKIIGQNPNNNGNVINLNLGENDNILNEDVIGNDDD